jgi:DNA modification methylase
MNQIIHADCLDVLKTLPDRSIDLLCTDPPYGLRLARKGSIGGRGNAFTPMSWDDAIPSKECFNEMLRVSKHQIIWGGNYFTDYLPPSRCWLIWYKRDNLPRNSFADCELAWTSFDRNAQVFNCRWFGFVKDSKEPKTGHPTQKALEVMKWCLREFSREGDTILDPFAGSGTTLLAAAQLGRNYIGIEREAEYISIIKARMAVAA